jgi:phosphonoacetaldehyde hydrolase
VAHRYTGPIRLVVADLAGTTVDYGSCAPAGAFIELFSRHGVEVTPEEARGPMGLQKRDHIAAMTRMPRVAETWKQAHGSLPDDGIIDAMYEEFIPLQVRCLPNYADIVPGVVETVEALRSRGIRIAATTGYNREMLEVVLTGAGDRGFVPDAGVCAEDVESGRPAPWMIYRCMESVDVFPPAAVLNIGDTLPDVLSGLNAGVWSVGVTRTGNMLGLSLAEDRALPEAERQTRLAAAEKSMRTAGAHYVVETFADVVDCLDAVEERLARGEQP